MIITTSARSRSERTCEDLISCRPGVTAKKACEFHAMTEMSPLYCPSRREGQAVGAGGMDLSSGVCAVLEVAPRARRSRRE